MATFQKAALLTAVVGYAVLAAALPAPAQEKTDTTAESIESSVQIPSPDEARAEHLRGEIQRILAQSQFKSLRPGERKPPPRWLRLLREFWDNLWSTVSGGTVKLGESNPWIIFVLIGLCALALLEMLRRVLRDSLFYSPKRTDSSGKSRMTPDEWLALAAKAHREGDNQEALRLVFHAALLSLFGESFEQAPSMQLAGELASTTGAPTDAFRQLNGSFERAFYGGATVENVDYERARGLTEELRRFARKEESDEA